MNDQLVALDFITGCLGIPSKSDINGILQFASSSEKFNWQAVIKIASNQQVTPALWVALRNRGLVETLPFRVREYLRESYQLNTLRNMHLREQAIKVVRVLNTIGVEPILLKGGASLFVKTFVDFGSRVMMDLDILVPKNAAKDCWNILLTQGYTTFDNKYSDNYYLFHHHLRPLYHPREYGLIEIHRDVLPNEVAQL